MLGWSGFGFVATSAVIAMAVSSALATNRSYVGGAGTGNWSTSSNWSPSGQPGQGDNAFISTTDALSRTVVFAPAGPVWFSYGDTLINSEGAGTSMLLNAGSAFETEFLTVARNGIYTQEQASASTFVHDMLLSQSGRLSIANGSFNAVNFTQIGGTVEFGPYNVSGLYSMQNGAMNGNVINTGTFDFLGGTSNGGLIENHGTFVYRGQTGSFLANVENYGTILMTTNPTLRSLRNHVSMFIGGETRLVTTDNLIGVAQTNGAFTMSGDSVVQTGRVWLDGGSWNQFGGRVAATNLNIGKAGGAESVYQLSSGTANITSAWVGELNTRGAIVQSGGQFTASTVTLGQRHATGTSASTGRYDLSGGTFETDTLIVGGKGSAAGTFNQSGGRASINKLIINDNQGSRGTVRITGGQFLAEDNGGAVVDNNGHIEVTGGWSAFGRIEGTGSVSVGGNGALNADHLRLNSVRLSENAKVMTHFTTSRLNQLSFDESGGVVHGQWNLLDGALILDHTGTSPMQSVKRWIRTGHAGGSWTGNGFMLTEAAVAPTPQNLAIGYAEASQLLGPNGGTFEGLPTDGSAVLVKSTYYGDADLNGVVNFDDYARVDAGFNNHGSDWFHGDFNYDGLVNFDDYALIDFAFSTQGQPMAVPAPEPSVALLGAMIAVAASVTRRRRPRAR